MNAKLNLELAEAVTEQIDGETWAYHYRYHLGAVDKPLPFEAFRTKYRLLKRYCEPLPDGSYQGSEADMLRLSRELGY